MKKTLAKYHWWLKVSDQVRYIGQQKTWVCLHLIKKYDIFVLFVYAGDEGEYTCTALNPYGEAICTVYISPEATKSVKKSKSGAKLHKSSSNKQILMAQQQQQV